MIKLDKKRICNDNFKYKSNFLCFMDNLILISNGIFTNTSITTATA